MTLLLILLNMGCRCANIPKATPLLQEESFVSCWPNVNAIPHPKGIDSSDPRLNAEHLLVLHKSGRRIMHYQSGKITLDQDGLHCWRVGLGGAPEGHKYAQGDERTPEGWYRTSNRRSSSYYGAINIHYPNGDDANAAFRSQRITKEQHKDLLRSAAMDEMPDGNTPLGGLILIHGSPKKAPMNPIGSKLDWTDGCAVLEDEHIDRLRSILPEQMRSDILILP